MMQPSPIVQPKERSPGDRLLQFPTSITAPFDVVGGTHFGRYPKISTEQTWNMIVSDGALVDFAGYELVTQIVQSGQGRELLNSTLFGSMIAVVNNGVYVINNSLGYAIVGTLATTNGDVYMADNLAGQIAIVDGLNVYIFNYNNNTFQTIAVDFLPVYITYQDTYFIAADGKTNQWRLSAASDGTSWPVDAQHVGELQTKACKCVATVALDRILLVMGQTVTEPWYDAGLQLFPYQRNPYYAIDYGCLSAATIASRFGMIVWLGSNEYSGLAILVSQEGGVPTPISFDGLDYLFSQLTAPTDAYGLLYKLDGHIIYQLTFPTDNHTYIYDFNTNMFFTLSDENLNYHIAKRIAYFNGNYYFLSFNDGNLYQMSSKFTDYNGNEIPRIRQPTNIRYPGGDRFVINNINFTMESGINQNPGRIDLSKSNDGGYSWGNVGSYQLRNLGKRDNRVDFWKIGGFWNDVVMRFRFLCYGRFVITGGTISLYR